MAGPSGERLNNPSSGDPVSLFALFEFIAYSTLTEPVRLGVRVSLA